MKFCFGSTEVLALVVQKFRFYRFSSSHSGFEEVLVLVSGSTEVLVLVGVMVLSKFWLGCTEVLVLQKFWFVVWVLQTVLFTFKFYRCSGSGNDSIKVLVLGLQMF